jgi:large subunit ribosomal protein L23
MIITPLSSEKNIRQIERDNVLAFIVERQASKADIKRAVEERFGVSVKKVRVLTNTSGQKHAYVKLAQESTALDVATDLGLI